MSTVFALLVALLLATSGQAQRDVISTARSRGLNSFVAAVEAANLANTLQNRNTDMTVFAPTNAAFASALQSLGFTSVADMAARDPTLLRATVMHHIVSGRDLEVDDLVKASPITTMLTGQRLTAARVGRTYTLTSAGGSTATITTADIEAGEAELHIICAVLLPDASLLTGGSTVITASPPPPPRSYIPGTKAASVYAALTTDPNLSSFAAVVQFAGLTATLQNTRTDMTVFAPTNAAFASALQSLGFTSVADMAARDPTLLRATVQHHVVSGRDLEADELVQASPITTLLAGQRLVATRVACVGTGCRSTYTVSSQGGANAVITVKDIDAGEAELHIIDAVLLPLEAATPAASLAQTIARDPSLSILTAALEATGLDGALSDPTLPYTLLAPSDAAFQSLLTKLNLTEGQLLSETALLTQVLSLHIIPTPLTSAQLVATATANAGALGARLPTHVVGRLLTVSRNANTLRVSSSSASTGNLATTSTVAGAGRVHIIDTVLLP